MIGATDNGSTLHLVCSIYDGDVGVRVKGTVTEVAFVAPAPVISLREKMLLGGAPTDPIDALVDQAVELDGRSMTVRAVERNAMEKRLVRLILT